MNEEAWPALPLADWKETYHTLHMWTQMVGKLQLALTPRTNHWWNVALHMTARGLTTTPMPVGPAGAAPARCGRDNARGLLARGVERGMVAGRRPRRLSPPRVLRLRRARAGRFSRRPHPARRDVLPSGNEDLHLPLRRHARRA